MKYLIVENEKEAEKIKAQFASAGITEVEVVIGALLNPEDSGEGALLRVQCFGNFEIFAAGGGTPLRFARSKSKELLAFMIDRKGAMLDIDQIRAALWDESVDDEVKKSYTRTLLADIRKTLEKAGHPDVLISRRNSYSVDISKVSCDYYDFLAAFDGTERTPAQAAAAAAFNGEYMSQYSWSETTLGLLTRMAKKR